MAMNGTQLGDDIAALLYAPNASEEAKARVKALWESIGQVVVSHIQDNIEVTVPANTVVTTVTGQAVGTKNAAPIETDVE